MRKILLIFLAAFFLAGCSTITEQQSATQVAVKKGLPVVYIHPIDNQAYSRASVGIMPFSLPANMDARWGVSVASIFQDIFLGKQTFNRVKLLSGQYGDTDEALTAGRKGTVDLVMAGRINYALEGTEFGGSRLDLSVRLINVKTGKTVWHIGQAMDQPMAYPKTDLLHSIFNSISPPPTKRSKGAPVVANMLAQCAVDMADVMGGARYVRR